MTRGILALGMSLGDFAVDERAVNDATLKGVHGLERDFPAGAVRLFGESARERDERFPALCAVVLAIDDDFARPELFLVEIGAGEELYRVESFAAIADGGAAVLARDFDDDFAVAFGSLRRRGEPHCTEQARDELLRVCRRGLPEGDPHFRFLKEPSFRENLYFDILSPGAELTERLFDGELNAARLFDN